MTKKFEYSSFDNLLEGCQIIGFDWQYKYVNYAAANHGHRSREELIGKIFKDIWPGIESTKLFRIIKRCLEERIPNNFINKFTFPDGTVSWFKLNIQSIPEGALILSIDITELKNANIKLEEQNKRLSAQNKEKIIREEELTKAIIEMKRNKIELQKAIFKSNQMEAALRASEQKYFLLFEKAVFAVSLSTMSNGVMVQVNDAFEKTFGYTKLEAIGKTSLELGINPDDEGRKRILTELRENGAARNIELDLRTKSGEVRTFSVNLDVMEFDNQKYILNTTQDITERKKAEKEIVKRLENIQALNKIDRSIAGSTDINITLNIVLEQVKTQLLVDAASILLFNPNTQIYEYAAGIGFRGKEIEESRLCLGEELAGSGVLTSTAMDVSGILENNDAQLSRATLLSGEGFKSYYGSPLIAKNQVNGILEIFYRKQFTPDDDWLEFLNILAEQTAVAVDNANLYTELKRSNTQLFAAYEHTIEGWSHALDLRDKETEGHTQRVTEMTLKLASAAGLTEEELVHVRRGALLHDIGKLGVPDHILLKPDKLTDEEWIVMKNHPEFAYQLLSPIEYLKPALCIPYCHHEKWDGSGYPRGLKGEQIPIEARLFSIVDVWDALLSDRPYRKGWPTEKAIKHIKSLAGKDFDPKVVELFLKLIEVDLNETSKYKNRNE